MSKIEYTATNAEYWGLAHWFADNYKTEYFTKNITICPECSVDLHDGRFTAFLEHYKQDHEEIITMIVLSWEPK